jgi:hypothetical protein
MNAKAPKVTGDAADVAQMDHIQVEIEKTVLRFTHNTDPLILIGALMRVVRLLVSLYKPGIRNSIISDNVAYLNAARSDQGRDQPRPMVTGLGPNFWLPPGSQN